MKRTLTPAEKEARLFDLITMSLFVMLFAVGIFTGFVIGRTDPRLIGIDCVGAAGPLYAHEEGDFPMCREIKRRKAFDD